MRFVGDGADRFDDVVKLLMSEEMAASAFCRMGIGRCMICPLEYG